MSNRRQRRLDHVKTQKGKIGKGFPTQQEARQGHTVTKYIEGQGLFEFTYYNNQWFKKKLETANQRDMTTSDVIHTSSIVVDETIVINGKQKGSVKGIKAEDIENTPLAGVVTPGYSGSIGNLKFTKPVTEKGQIGFDNDSSSFEFKQSDNDKILYSGSATKIHRDVNDGNPTFQVGSSDTENFKIDVNYQSSGKGVSNVVLSTNTASSTADMGTIHLKVDGMRHTILEDAGMRLYGKTFTINDGSDSDDLFKIETTTNGETTISTVDAGVDDGAVGHLNIEPDGHVEFDGCGVGFDLVTPTYNASDTDVDFRAGNKQFVTFGSGNIADLNLKFPATSGNFTLLLKQDGTGSRTVAADGWLVFDSAGNAAAGSSTVKFAGGSNPTLTTDANHVDIISFFWDSDNEIAYGVATLDFQF